MRSASVDYCRASDTAHTCELLKQHGSDAKRIAGGQSLAPMMAMRLTRPAMLIDINEIAALKFMTIEKAMVRTGAGTRNRGTLGDSFAHADPAAEPP